MIVEIGKIYEHEDFGLIKVLGKSSVSPSYVKAIMLKANDSAVYNILIDRLRPMTSKSEYPKEMLVWDYGYTKARKKIVLGYYPELPKPYLVQGETSEEYFGYDYAKDIPRTKEVTMQEIADKFNIPVEQLKIKK